MGFLRLSEDDIEVVTTALNNARIIIFTEKQQARLPSLLYRLRRHYVATFEEKRQDLREWDRKPGATASLPPGLTGLPFEVDEIVKSPPAPPRG